MELVGIFQTPLPVSLTCKDLCIDMAVPRSILGKDDVSFWVRTSVRKLRCREGPTWRETGGLHGVNTHAGG